ncbi:RNA polymerase III subunit RPC82 helix-turn-helix domain-containing protein [Fimicolochytrium jonesii]|uniref:RNA polymerase III subunit RPC82 helix-turn-helix domain-containing protein n=1 Tax=Fimicolochytrium jonesii TaxID=1396493 RepID=UPI0022FE79C5|nr:RNA polymerase III subunit RPC82 helix-turn-helix domain-containing protein [Fimicolochytrium jonesii]KAI8818623.1 RNA polymerase III subunit RPC82 helix-turn-helix domain-containing protein [Fimicolochytrium jonesii]
MPAAKLRLCRAILKEHFGPIVEKVGYALLERGRSPLSILIRRTELPASKVREALFVLIQHGIVTYAETPEGARMVVYYQAEARSIIVRDRIPIYLQIVRKRCGEDAERMLCETLWHGRANYDHLIDKARAPGVSHDQLAEAFSKLTDMRVLVACTPEGSLSIDDRRMTEEAQEVARRGGLPLTATEMTKLRKELALKRDAQYDDKVETGSKRKVVLDLDEVANKRLAKDEKSEEKDTKYYRANLDKLHVFLRNEEIALLVERRMNKGAGEVVKKLLTASENKMRQCREEEKSEPVSQIMLSSLLDPSIPLLVDGRSGASATREYLDALTQDDTQLIKKASEGGGGQYTVNLKQAGIELRSRCMESIVQEKFGDTAKRVWRILLAMNKLNETQVSKMALIPLKMARHCLYALMNAGLAFIQDVPKTVDHSAARTFFLWYVSIPKSTRILQQNTYRTLWNVKERREKERDARALLIQKMERSDIVSGEAQLSEAELINVDHLNRVVSQLVMTESRLSRLLMVLEEF